MKKAIALVFAASLLLAGCGQAAGPVPAPPVSQSAGAGTPASSSPHGGVSLPTASGDVIEISEKLFIAQTNDIYLNGEDYIGKTIKYEGLYKNSASWNNGLDDVIHFVIRYGPGCCGYDGEAGFQVRWDGAFPEVDDWVEVVGTIEQEKYDSGYMLLYVSVTSLTVKQECGAEFVST